MIEELISRWGHLGIAVGTFFEGEAVLLMGGALAHKGLLKFPEVVVAAFVGSLLGDQFWFFLGRRLGARFIARRPNWQARTERVGAVVARWGDLFVLGFRFVWGLRSVAPFVLANSAYSWLRFAVLNVVGAAIWAVTVAWLGWIAGAGFERAAGRVGRWEEIVLGLGALALGFGILRWYLRSRRSVPP